MRKWKQADLWLTGSALLFIGVMIWHLQSDWEWSEWVYYTAQAALIGSVADWFAVSAVFSKPLGIPWHTNLVARHRNELIAGVGRVVEEKLVRPELWNELATKRNLTDILANYWADPVQRRRITRRLRAVAEEGLRRIDGRNFIAPAAQLVRERLNEIDIYEILLRQGERDELLSELATQTANSAADYLDTPEVYRYLRDEVERLAIANTQSGWGRIGRWLGEVTGVLDYADIASGVQASLRDFTRRLADPDSADHGELVEVMREIAQVRLREPATKELIENWRHELVDRLPVEDILEQIRAELANTWLYPRGNSKLGAELTFVALRGIDAFFADPALRARVDNALRGYIVQLGRSEHKRIGDIVTDVLSVYDEDKLNRFVREKTEDELAQIRINGATVGAVIGAIVWAILHFLYEPLLM